MRDTWQDCEQRDLAYPVAQAIFDNGLRLPSLEESTAKTVWMQEGQRGMALALDLLPAIKAARAALKAARQSDEYHDSEIATEAVLGLVAFLNYERPPPCEVSRVLHSATHDGPRVPPKYPEYQIGLPPAVRRQSFRSGCVPVVAPPAFHFSVHPTANRSKIEALSPSNLCNHFVDFSFGGATGIHVGLWR